jgi:hypothetical protein
MLITTSLAGYWRSGKFVTRPILFPQTDLLLFLQKKDRESLGTIGLLSSFTKNALLPELPKIS